MSRYIDADAYAAEMKTRQDACLELMNATREMDNEEMYGQKSVAFSVFVEAKLTLDAMPTVDAVPVVRCRECKWLHIVNDNILYGFCTKGHAMFYPFQLDTREFYCADGERRSNGKADNL